MAVRSISTSTPARAKEIGSSATAENIARLITRPINRVSVRPWSHEIVITPRKLAIAPIAIARATAVARLGTKAIAPTITPRKPVKPSSIKSRRLKLLTDPAPTTPVRDPTPAAPTSVPKAPAPPETRLGEDGSTDVQRSHHGEVGSEQYQATASE